MAGPGGGGRGGGGFSGGSFGGGFSGGSSFRGSSFSGHHHNTTHHSNSKTSNGCGCGFAAIFIIFTFIALISFFNIAQPTEDYVVLNSNGEKISANEDGIYYDEITMQDYANENYKEIFGSYEGYEDNILLVFLANEQADGYCTIAWVGDNIKYEINEMFGEYTEYGLYLDKYINDEYYAYSLDTSLAEVISDMENSITVLQLDSSFRSEPVAAEGKKSELINYTEFELNKELVNSALESFTENTGIPCVILVDMAEKVFGGGNEAVTEKVTDDSVQATITVTDDEEPEDIATLYFRGLFIIFIGAVAVIGVIVVIILAVVKKRKKESNKNNEAPKNDMPWES